VRSVEIHVTKRKKAKHIVDRRTIEREVKGDVGQKGFRYPVGNVVVNSGAYKVGKLGSINHMGE